MALNEPGPAAGAGRETRDLYGIALGAVGVLAGVVGVVGVLFRVWLNEWSLIVWFAGSLVALLFGIICFFHWGRLFNRGAQPAPRPLEIVGRVVALLAIALAAVNTVFYAIPMVMLVLYMP